MKLLQTFALALACQSLAPASPALAEQPGGAAPAAVTPAKGANAVRQTNITLAKETTRITEPLTAEGYPDYVAYLEKQASQGVTPKTNAVVLFWQVVGPKELDAKIREEYFRRLGVPVPDEKGEYLLEVRDYATSAGLIAAGDDGKLLDQLLDQLDEAMGRPWTEKEFPTLAKWLTASQRPLQLAVEMTLRPHYYAPLVTNAKSFRMMYALMPTVQSSRMIARALTARAMLRLGDKNLHGAWDDVMAVRRLARVVDRGPFLIDGLVAFAIAGVASNAEAAVMHFGRPTRLQIAQFRKQRDAIGPLTSMADRLDGGERLYMLDCVCGIQQQGPSSIASLGSLSADDPDSPVAVLFRIAMNSCIDWDTALQVSNEAFDRLAAAARLRDCQKRNRAADGYEKWLRHVSAGVSTTAPTIPLLALGGNEGRKVAGKIAAGYGIALFMPGFGAVLQAEQRMESIDRRGDIVIALADYRADHGEYPARLADLVPKYLKALPRDTFTDAQFSYERTEKGFRLYCVGKNGVDDFGRNNQWEGDGHGPASDDWLLTMPPKRQ